MSAYFIFDMFHSSFDFGMEWIPNYFQPLLKIYSHILRKILLSCTIEVPFSDHHSNVYLQLESNPMGSTIGSTFSNFYMARLDNSFQLYKKKTKIY